MGTSLGPTSPCSLTDLTDLKDKEERKQEKAKGSRHSLNHSPLLLKSEKEYLDMVGFESRLLHFLQLMTARTVLTALTQSDPSRGLSTKAYQDMDISISIGE
jgi:hypothetical protein